VSRGLVVARTRHAGMMMRAMRIVGQFILNTPIP
jgi:hypothetical protein